MIDLHIHTTMSDGQLSPAQVVDAAAQNGLAAISITDHDTVSGLRESMGLRPHAARTYTAIKNSPGVSIGSGLGNLCFQDISLLEKLQPI